MNGDPRGFALSLRAKILLIIVFGAVVPLAVVGVWLAASVKRSGEDILRSRLDSTLARAARDIGESWVQRRSTLLSIAEDSVVRAAISAKSRVPIPLTHLVTDLADVRGNTEMI